MLCKLSIDYFDFILDDKGISTVIKALSKAHRVRDNRHSNGGFETLNDGKPIKVTFEPLPHFRWVKRKDKPTEVLEPEVLPPDRAPALPPPSKPMLEYPSSHRRPFFLTEGGR